MRLKTEKLIDFSISSIVLDFSHLILVFLPEHLIFSLSPLFFDNFCFNLLSNIIQSDIWDVS